MTGPLDVDLSDHERGAFTGAVAAREGALEEANGGTIFLDEIGELPLDLQPKLLRALDKREIERVGSNRYFGVDIRVVAATNRDLKREVNEKRFRADPLKVARENWTRALERHYFQEMMRRSGGNLAAAR